MNGLESNTTGSFNTACGNAALYTNTTGSQNTATGYGALGYATGTGNIAVGYIAGSNLTTGNNNIDIFDPGLAAEASTIRIGTQGTQITTYIAGIQGTTLGTGTPVYVNANGQLGTVTSSRRFKTDIRDMGTASNVVLALRPVTFRYKPEIDPSTTPQYGLVAEEVAKVSPNLVVRDKNNQIYSVRYDAVNAMLLNEFQKEHEALLRQQREIEILKNEVNALKGNEQTSPASTSRAID
jgi:hypothetical protein